MAAVTKICRVCGKEYKACMAKATGAFRWQEVACSPECGAEYFERIRLSRLPATEKKQKKSKKQESVKAAVVEEVLPEAKDVEAVEPERPAEE